MGQCYEFGVAIHEGCGHAMRVGDDGGACVCPTCGAYCEGRFAGCGPILEQAGYVPVTAPSWAVECTERPEPTTTLHRLPRPTGNGRVAADGEVLPQGGAELDAINGRVAADDEVLPQGGAELDAIRGELRALVEPAVAEAVEHAQARLADVFRAQRVQASDPALTGLRNEVLGVVDAMRREVADHAKELDETCERLSASYTQLVTGYQEDRAATRSVIVGLARRVDRLERALGTDPPVPPIEGPAK